MTAELVFFLATLWVLLGLIDAWVLHESGWPGWRWILVCALAGPLSLSIVDPHVRRTDTDSSTTANASSVANDDAPSDATSLIEWPRDDPETRKPFDRARPRSPHRASRRSNERRQGGRSRDTEEMQSTDHVLSGRLGKALRPRRRFL